MTVYVDPVTNRRITIAPFSVNSSGDNTLIAATTGEKIYVVSVLLIPDADNAKIRFKSGSNNLSGVMNLSKAGNGFHLAPANAPHLVTNRGEALILNLDAAVTVAGYVQYYYDL